jgi:hypothetical protein
MGLVRERSGRSHELSNFPACSIPGPRIEGSETGKAEELRRRHSVPEGRSLEVAQPLVGGIADDVLDGLVVLYQSDVARRLLRTPCSWAATQPDSRSEGGLVEGGRVRGSPNSQRGRWGTNGWQAFGGRDTLFYKRLLDGTDAVTI